MATQFPSFCISKLLQVSSSTAKQARKHIEAQFSAVEEELRGSMREWKKEQLEKLQAFKEEVFQPQAIKDALTSVRKQSVTVVTWLGVL